MKKNQKYFDKITSFCEGSEDFLRIYIFEMESLK
jgi:hypothetical protein